MPLTLQQLLTRKPKSRSYKQACADEESATHRLSLSIRGVGANCDMDFFRAVGAYSDDSGCGMSERDHGWYLASQEAAEEAATHLELMIGSLEVLNKTSFPFTIKITKIR